MFTLLCFFGLSVGNPLPVDPLPVASAQEVLPDQMAMPADPFSLQLRLDYLEFQKNLLKNHTNTATGVMDRAQGISVLDSYKAYAKQNGKAMQNQVKRMVVDQRRLLEDAKQSTATQEKALTEYREKRNILKAHHLAQVEERRQSSLAKVKRLHELRLADLKKGKGNEAALVHEVEAMAKQLRIEYQEVERKAQADADRDVAALEKFYGGEFSKMDENNRKLSDVIAQDEAQVKNAFSSWKTQVAEAEAKAQSDEQKMSQDTLERLKQARAKSLADTQNDLARHREAAKQEDWTLEQARQAEANLIKRMKEDANREVEEGHTQMGQLALQAKRQKDELRLAEIQTIKERLAKAQGLSGDQGHMMEGIQQNQGPVLQNLRKKELDRLHEATQEIKNVVAEEAQDTRNAEASKKQVQALIEAEYQVKARARSLEVKEVERGHLQRIGEIKKRVAALKAQFAKEIEEEHALLKEGLEALKQRQSEAIKEKVAHLHEIAKELGLELNLRKVFASDAGIAEAKKSQALLDVTRTENKENAKVRDDRVKAGAKEVEAAVNFTQRLETQIGKRLDRFTDIRSQEIQDERAEYKKVLEAHADQMRTAKAKANSSVKLTEAQLMKKMNDLEKESNDRVLRVQSQNQKDFATQIHDMETLRATNRQKEKLFKEHTIAFLQKSQATLEAEYQKDLKALGELSAEFRRREEQIRADEDKRFKLDDENFQNLFHSKQDVQKKAQEWEAQQVEAEKKALEKLRQTHVQRNQQRIDAAHRQYEEERAIKESQVKLEQARGTGLLEALHRRFLREAKVNAAKVQIEADAWKSISENTKNIREALRKSQEDQLKELIEEEKANLSRLNAQHAEMKLAQTTETDKIEKELEELNSKLILYVGAK